MTPPARPWWRRCWSPSAVPACWDTEEEEITTREAPASWDAYGRVGVLRLEVGRPDQPRSGQKQAS